MGSPTRDFSSLYMCKYQWDERVREKLEDGKSVSKQDWVDSSISQQEGCAAGKIAKTR